MAALDVSHRTASIQHKRWGAVFLAVPTLIVAMFAIGEGVGGEEGWWGHLIQLGLAAVVFLGAWFLPKIGGPVLIGLAILFGGWTLSRGEDLVGEWTSLAIIGLPLLVSGVFFSLAGYRDTPT